MSLAAKDGSLPRIQHVPAWKRLGLKLKYAKDSTEELPLPLPTGSGTQESLGTSFGEDEADRTVERERPVKKRKVLTDSQPDCGLLEPNGFARDSKEHQSTVAPSSVASTRQTVETASKDSRPSRVPRSGNEDNQQKHPTNDAEPQPRRKSVTFTPDTKQEDSFSASSSLEHETTDHQATAPEALIPEQLPSLGKKLKKGNKKDRKRPERAPKFENDSDSREIADESIVSKPAEVPVYVQYLQLFHADRASWKFNKKNQKDLLKNLFNIEQVPTGLNPAILDYVAGLQGTGARQRLAESATSILEDIAGRNSNTDVLDGMETEEARRAAYKAALQRQIERSERAGPGSSEYDDQQRESMRRDAERGDRAEAVLGELLQKELYPEQPHAEDNGALQASNGHVDATDDRHASRTNANTSNSKSTSKRKKRKSRTQATSDELDSSESEHGGDTGRPSATGNAPSSTQDWKPQSQPEKSVFEQFRGKKKVFDDDLLDRVFSKKGR